MIHHNNGYKSRKLRPNMPKFVVLYEQSNGNDASHEIETRRLDYNASNMRKAIELAIDELYDVDVLSARIKRDNEIFNDWKPISPTIPLEARSE